MENYYFSDESEDETEKCDQIRDIASRNWLKPASVSLAKLDQVRATIYNVSITDSKNLKARAVSHRTTETPAEPPLSTVVSQAHAWDYGAEIPTLIKQQTDKQRSRPESAKVSRQTRPPSGKRARPQSAKEHGIADGAKQNLFGVRGARSGLRERPPGGIPQGMTPGGWVSGAVDPHSQINPYDDLAFPPPPRGSPDFMEMLDSAQPKSVADDLVESSPKTLSRPLLRRPTPEPIHLTLPTAEIHESVELDTPRLIQAADEHLEVSHKPGFSYVHVNKVDKLPEGTTARPNSPSDLLANMDDKEPNDTLSPVAPNGETRVIKHHSIEIPFHRNLSEHSQTSGGLESTSGDGTTVMEDKPTPKDDVIDDLADDAAEKKGNLNVQFVEERNVMVDITPRDQRSARSRQVITRHRPKSSRHDLRYVKSKVDSGIKLTGGGGKGLERRGSEINIRDNIDGGKSYSRTQSKDSMVSSASSDGKVSQVSVEYIDGGSDVDLRLKKSSRRNKLPRAKSDVETMISNISISDDENGGEGNRSQESDRSDKSVQSARDQLIPKSNRNFYELAKAAGKGQVHKMQNEKEIVQHKYKTTKTLEFGDGEIKETKSVSLIGTVVTPQREPVQQRPERPPSAQRSRPPLTKTKTGSGSSSSVDTVKSTKPAQPPAPPRAAPTEEEPALPEPAAQPTATQSSHSLDEISHTPSVKLRKRRVVSAPASRMHDRAEAERRLKARQMFSQNLNKLNKNGFGGIQKSRNNRQLKEGPQCKPPESRNQKAYSNYSRAPQENDGGAAARRRAEQMKRRDTDVIEIWTRQEDFEMETEGVQECKEIQQKLLDKGIPISLSTLKRALLPPAEYNFYGPLKAQSIVPKLPSYSAGLLSEPSVWLADEHKKVEKAKTAVKKLLQRKEEEVPEDESDNRSDVTNVTASSNRSRKSSKGSRSKRVKSACL